MDGSRALVDIPHQNWLNNKNLDFIGEINYTTGELLQELKCKYKGQYLSIVKGREKIYCNMRGSLATFYNCGLHNFFDYTYQNFLDTLPKLKSELDIIPEKTIFRNFEFAVLFESPVKSNKLWEFMKSHNNVKFSNIIIDGKMVGIQTEHQRYILKFYDKEFQFTGNHSNIIKYEIVIKKMIEVKEMGLKILSDFKNPNIWFLLSQKLLKHWNEILIVDENLDIKAMGNYEQKKFLMFKDANYWNNLNSIYKDYQYYKKLLQKYQTKAHIQDIINNLIVEKCIKNVTEKNKEIGYQLTKYLKPLSKHIQTKNLLSINRYDKGLIYTQNHSQEQEEKGGGEKAQKRTQKCKCRDCRKSLRNKKSNAFFCSNACRQKYHNHKKKLQVEKEKGILANMISRNTQTEIILGLKFYNDNSGNLEYFRYDEVWASRDVIKDLKEVFLFRKPTAKPQRLTHARARGLVRFLSGKNNERCFERLKC